MIRKKWMALGLAAVLSLSGFSPAIVGAEEDAATEAASAADDIAATQEGYTETGDGYISVVAWCKNEAENRNIYGKFYYSEDFDETKTYPTIIMSHGLSVTHEIYEKAGWVYLAARQGYVCYTFDFCGGSDRSLSDMDFMEMSVLTEKSDLYAVMDFVEGKDFCDKSNLFLMGQSQGGLVTALTGAERKDEVAGMILLYPALHIPENVRGSFGAIDDISEEGVVLNNTQLGSRYGKDAYDIDVLSEISAYDKDVLLIHGLNDQSVPYSYSVDALA